MDNKNITSVSMTTYITFSIVFFVIGLFNNWSVVQYLIMFLLFTFVLQLTMNIWASGKLCTKDSKKKEVDLGKSLTYTLVPWVFILCLICAILYIMPGWVRVFSNTIGLAVVKSIYSDLFTLKEETSERRGTNNAVDGESVSSNNAVDVVESSVPQELITQIYHDPSKLINEAEYIPDFEEWVNKELKFLRTMPYFKNKEFDPQDGLYDANLDERGNKIINKKHSAYQLYMCIATKEKIGYFIWLFLSGSIFVLTSLSQMYEADC